MQEQSSKETTRHDMAGVSVWVLTNGMAGFETQAIGVAEALGATPIIKRVNPGKPWRWLAPHGPAAPNAAISAPWPDLLIASGRQAIPYARMIRRKSGGRTFTVILQNPRVNPANFDLVWAPLHDRLSGANVISTLFSPHRLTKTRLAEEATRMEPLIAHLPRPRVAVLLGGTNSVYRLSDEVADEIGKKLAAYAKATGASLMVTPSRRTGTTQMQAISKALTDTPAFIWDGTGDNPYFAFLGQADAVIVTCDSVNMVGEAAFTQKPVHVIELEGGSAKFRRFLDAAYENGVARPFDGRLESGWQPPLNANLSNPTEEVAQAIRLRFPKHRAQYEKG